MDEETRILMKKALQGQGMTQEKFAELAEVSGAMVSLWLSGKRNMHPVMEKHIRRVAKELTEKA